jgi:hypothetical protein
MLERLAISWRDPDRFSLRVYGAVADLRITGPGRHQAPTHQDNLTITGIAVEPDDGLEGLRGYVVGRAEVGDRRAMHLEVLSDALFIGAANVAATDDYTSSSSGGR